MTSPRVNEKHRCSRREAESWRLKAGGSWLKARVRGLQAGGWGLEA